MKNKKEVKNTRFCWNITVSGVGKTPEEAWDNFIEDVMAGDYLMLMPDDVDDIIIEEE